MDSLVQLAHSTIVSFVQTGRAEISDELKNSIPNKRAGVFVSIHSAAGQLRGCIGTILPSRETMADEIIQNAQWACSRDHRFRPVAKNELDGLNIKVDVLSEPEPIESTDQLNPDKYGVIVSTADGRRGLLLPALDGIETAEAQIEICRKKGGIRPDEPITLQRFTVERH